MSIKFGTSNISAIYLGSTTIKEVWRGTNLVYSSDKGNLSLWRYSNSELTGKTLLYEYTGSDWANTLYVPKCGGNSVLNDSPQSYVGVPNVPFINKQSLKRVDLQSVPFRNNSMNFAFLACYNLNSVLNINSSTLFMNGTFGYCRNFNQNIKLPLSVYRLDNTFESCGSFNQNISIPNTVASMQWTFARSHNFNQNISIPNSVGTLDGCFSECNRFNQNLSIPNSVFSLESTFNGCSSLNQSIQVPNSVIRMDFTFAGCSSLNCSIEISSGVNSLNNTFYGCSSLRQNIDIHSRVEYMPYTFYSSAVNWVSIHSSEVKNANGCFNACADVKVIIPSRYINNVTTNTYNSLKTAGWSITNAGASVGGAYNKISGYDWIGGDYNTYTGNGTHWILSKWNGKLTEDIGNFVFYNSVDVPQYYDTYSIFPTAITSSCFYANKIVESLKVNQVPFSGTSCLNGFRLMSNCLSITGVNIPSGITDPYTLFYEVTNATCLSTGGYISSTGYTVLPSTAIKGGIYGKTKEISNYYLYGTGVTNLGYCFDYVNTRPINAYIEPANVTTIVNFMRGPNASYRKNIYIPFKYSNGALTKTYNCFKTATFMGTSGVSSIANPGYNSKGNWYIYNLDPSSIFSYSGLNPMRNIESYNSSSPMKCVALMPEYPDFSIGYVGNRAFSGSTSIQALDLRNVPFNSTDLSSAFSECRNLTSVTNINFHDYSGYPVRSLYRTFYNCRNLEYISAIPNTVTSMQETLRNCNVSDLTILSTELQTFTDAFDPWRNIYIYFKYANGANTKTYNLLKNVYQGELYNLGIAPRY